MEEILFPIKAFFTLLRVVAFIALVVVVIAFFTQARAQLNDKELERTFTEIADGIAHEKLTAGYDVFKKSELDKYDKKNIEPYARHCRYGYYLEIESDGKKWAFGYKPPSYFSHVTHEYPAAIAETDDFYNTATPAKMKLTVYDAWLSRISCMAEDAYINKEIQTERFPCINENSRGCNLAVRKENGDRRADYICEFSKQPSPPPVPAPTPGTTPPSTPATAPATVPPTVLPPPSGTPTPPTTPATIPATASRTPTPTGTPTPGPTGALTAQTLRVTGQMAAGDGSGAPTGPNPTPAPTPSPGTPTSSAPTSNLFYQDSANCRYLPNIYVKTFYYSYAKTKADKFLAAIPIKEGSMDSIPDETGDCRNIPKDKIAGHSDNVGGVALCINEETK